MLIEFIGGKMDGMMEWVPDKCSDCYEEVNNIGDVINTRRNDSLLLNQARTAATIGSADFQLRTSDGGGQTYKPVYVPHHHTRLQPVYT